MTSTLASQPLRSYVLRLDYGHRGYVAGGSRSGAYYTADLSKARHFTKEEAEAFALPHEIPVPLEEALRPLAS